MQKPRILCSLRQFISKHNVNRKWYTTEPPSASDDEKEKELERIAKSATIDEPPTTCCQSGCSNCVFIVWAEALAAKLNANPEIAEKIINSVEDPSMKAYLEMELKIRGLKK